MSGSRTGAWNLVTLFLHGVEDRNNVGGVFRRAETAGHSRLTVGLRLSVEISFVQIMLVVGPIPCGDDDVALDALRPLRLVIGQFALGDAVGPLGENI